MRPRPAMAAAGAGLVALAAVWLAWRWTRDAAHDAQPEPAAGDGAASAVALPPPPPSPVELLREKAPAGKDRFRVEEIEELLAPRLRDLGRLLVEVLDEPVARALRESTFAADFRAEATAPAETALEKKAISPGVEVAEARSFAGEALDAGAFLAALRAGSGGMERVEGANLKAIRIEPGETEAPTEIHFRLWGQAAAAIGAGRLQWQGRALLHWRLDAEASVAQLRLWRTLEWTTCRLAFPPFAEVTAEALGDAPAWKRILARSLDDFRLELDGACGVEVYGHHGVAVGDADGDGLEDLYVSMPSGLPNLLWRGRGDGRFEDWSATSGADVLDGTSCALFLDLDNNGDQDLFLVTDSGPEVLRNQGQGRFTLIADAARIATTARSTPTSAAAADVDLDGDLDVYVAFYVYWRGAGTAIDTGLPIPYHDARNGAPNALLRNRGDGTFEDATAASGLMQNNDRFSFAVAFQDYDEDGDPDLYVANDFGSNNLYRNRGPEQPGVFEDVAAAAGVLDTGPGMSCAWEDVDLDGRADLLVGNMFSSAGRRVTGTADYRFSQPELRDTLRRHARGNSLFLNRGEAFADASVESGTTYGLWAWASGFVDFNLDGREDIFVQNGFITQSETRDL